MARCPKGFRLNEYRNVDVPTVRQLYSRFGDRTKLKSYTTSLLETDVDPVPMNENKLSSVQRAVSYAMSLKEKDEN